MLHIIIYIILQKQASDINLIMIKETKLTFSTGVKYSATPKAVPLKLFMTFCISNFETKNTAKFPLVENTHSPPKMRSCSVWRFSAHYSVFWYILSSAQSHGGTSWSRSCQKKFNVNILNCGGNTIPHFALLFRFWKVMLQS